MVFLPLYDLIWYLELWIFLLEVFGNQTTRIEKEESYTGKDDF